MKSIGYREGRRAAQEDKKISRKETHLAKSPSPKILPEMNELILLETDRLTWCLVKKIF